MFVPLLCFYWLCDVISYSFGILIILQSPRASFNHDEFWLNSQFVSHLVGCWFQFYLFGCSFYNLSGWLPMVASLFVCSISFLYLSQFKIFFFFWNVMFYGFILVLKTQIFFFHNFSLFIYFLHIHLLIYGMICCIRYYISQMYSWLSLSVAEYLRFLSFLVVFSDTLNVCISLLLVLFYMKANIFSIGYQDWIWVGFCFHCKGCLWSENCSEKRWILQI